MSGISQADAFDMLARRLEHARKEHPRFAETTERGIMVVDAEMSELYLAYWNNEGPARILDKALDVAATAMRLVMGEVEG
jgi:hypothetical protein